MTREKKYIRNQFGSDTVLTYVNPDKVLITMLTTCLTQNCSRNTICKYISGGIRIHSTASNYSLYIVTSIRAVSKRTFCWFN